MKANPQQMRVTQQWACAAPLIACRFDPSGEFVFASTEDYTVQRWRMTDGHKISYPVAHESWVGALAFVDKGKTLVTGGYDGRILWWPVTGDKPQPLRNRCTRRLGEDAGRQPGRQVDCLGRQRPTREGVERGGRQARARVGRPRQPRLLRLLSSQRRFLSGDLKAELRQWDVATGKTVRTFDAKALHAYEPGERVDYGGVRTLALTSDGQHLVAAGLFNGFQPARGR